MAEGRAVFWELGLAEKEKDPNDPTGKRFQAICRCKVDKDDPISVMFILSLFTDGKSKIKNQIKNQIILLLK